MAGFLEIMSKEGKKRLLETVIHRISQLQDREFSLKDIIFDTNYAYVYIAEMLQYLRGEGLLSQDSGVFKVIDADLLKKLEENKPVEKPKCPTCGKEI